MKRLALLIANTNGLEGTKADIGKFSRFLQSLQGGAWEEDTEICVISNPEKNELLAYASRIKQYNIDYAVVMFSGHGGYRDETILEINDSGDTISVSALLQLAQRQLSIFDCCRVMETPVLRKSLREDSAMFSSSGVTFRDIIRKKYEARILQAIPQQTILYACSVGECSYDSKNGAVYIDNLIRVAHEVSGNEFMAVGQAHKTAAELTIDITTENPAEYDDGPQHPEAHLPKCLSSQQLVISINPSF